MLPESSIFDKLNAREGPTFHGHKYESGEARRAVSYAEPVLMGPEGFSDHMATVAVNLFSLLKYSYLINLDCRIIFICLPCFTSSNR